MDNSIHWSYSFCIAHREVNAVVVDPASSAPGPFVKAAVEGVAEELSPRPDSNELHMPGTSTNSCCDSRVQPCPQAYVGNPRYSSSTLNLGSGSTKNPCLSESPPGVFSVLPSRGSACAALSTLKHGEAPLLLLEQSAPGSSPSHGGAFPMSRARSPQTTIALDVSIEPARAPVPRRPPSLGVLVLKSLVPNPPGAGAP